MSLSHENSGTEPHVPQITKIDIFRYCDDHVFRGACNERSLTPELDQFVATKVSSGRYISASEVVREALRLLEERDQARSAQISVFNQELGKRLESLDHGEHIHPTVARERLERKSRERKKRTA